MNPMGRYGTGTIAVLACGILYWMNAASIRNDVALGYDRTLVACTLFRDDAMYLDEWVRFHAAMGVEHFYLYNHGSVDNYKEVLAPFIESGMVTLTDWPPMHTIGTDYACKRVEDIAPGVHRQAACQRLAFGDCILRAKRSRSEWIAIMDVDEFFYTPGDTCEDGSLKNALLKEPMNVASVIVNGWISGTQGYEHPVSGSVIGNYLYRNPKDGVVNDNPVWQHNDAIKSIGRSSHVESSTVHHFVQSWGSFLALYTVQRYKLRPPGAMSRIRMRHYQYRSYESIIRKVLRNGYAGISYRADRDYWSCGQLDLELYNCSRALGLVGDMSDYARYTRGEEKVDVTLCTIIMHSNAEDNIVKVRKSFWSVYRGNFSDMVVVVDTIGSDEVENFFAKYAPSKGVGYIRLASFTNASDVCGGGHVSNVLWVPRASWEYTNGTRGGGGGGEPPIIWNLTDNSTVELNMTYIDIPSTAFPAIWRWW